MTSLERPSSILSRISSDEYCPNCDNHFVLEAVTPKAALKVESDDVRMDSRWAMIKFSRKAMLMMYHRMLKDDRTRQADLQTIFDLKGNDSRLG